MQNDAEPARKAPRKVPLVLQDKFYAEIQSMVKQGILTEVKQTMETPEWLNSFVVVKNPSGNLRVCIDPTDLNKHIIRPVCNMYMSCFPANCVELTHLDSLPVGRECV